MIDARAIHDEVVLRINALLARAMAQCAHAIKVYDSDDSAQVKVQSKAVVVNSRSWARSELLTVRNGDASVLSEADKKLSQVTHDQQTLVKVDAASYSLSPLRALPPTEKVSVHHDEKSECFVLENGHLRHKATGREALAIHADSDGLGGNNLLLFDDKPLFWDAGRQLDPLRPPTHAPSKS